jgi:RNA-directed DNA polymerase
MRKDLNPGMKPGNAGEAKGGREANPSKSGSCEATPARVPEGDKQAGEDLWQRYGAERGIWSEKMLAALQQGVKGNQWFSLIDKVYAERTLALSWDKVRSNAGACGVDGVTVERFDKDSQKRLLAVKEQLKEGRYASQLIKRVWIPKPGSYEKRPLGIPTVRDRVVQTALRMVIEPIFEHEFAEHSYGFRPGRSCRDALRRVDDLLQSGNQHVVEVDIKGYFDAIPHERLMELVRQRIADGRVLVLIESFLKAGIMEGMEGSDVNETGTPQGGVISPLLANIYLNPLDWLMAQADFEMVRYADDMVVLCKDNTKAQAALELIHAWMRDAGLILHPEKTRVVDLAMSGSYFEFLGYKFQRGKGEGLHRYIRNKSQQKLRERLKPLTTRANGHSMEAIIQKINPILKGWYGYFKHASERALKLTDGWVRGRLRAILRKRAHRRGIARGEDHRRWKNCYFAALGLFSLEQARAAEIANLSRANR